MSLQEANVRAFCDFCKLSKMDELIVTFFVDEVS